jgi:hypothetical protein
MKTQALVYFQARDEEGVVITFEKRFGKRARSTTDWHNYRAKRSDWSVGTTNKNHSPMQRPVVTLERFNYHKVANRVQDVGESRLISSAGNLEEKIKKNDNDFIEEEIRIPTDSNMDEPQHDSFSSEHVADKDDFQTSSHVVIKQDISSRNEPSVGVPNEEEEGGNQNEEMPVDAAKEDDNDDLEEENCGSGLRIKEEKKRGNESPTSPMHSDSQLTINLAPEKYTTTADGKKLKTLHQCSGSGYGIRCFFTAWFRGKIFWIRDPDSG